MNKIILTGHLGRDPELKYLGTGTAVVNFDIATKETRKDKDGNKEGNTDWHKIVAFGKLAEICGEWLKKGSHVLVEGKLKTRSWEDKSNNTRKTTEVVIDKMEMLDSRKSVAREVEAPEAGPSEPMQPNQGPGVLDDLPF